MSNEGANPTKSNKPRDRRRRWQKHPKKGKDDTPKLDTGISTEEHTSVDPSEADAAASEKLASPTQEVKPPMRKSRPMPSHFISLRVPAGHSVIAGIDAFHRNVPTKFRKAIYKSRNAHISLQILCLTPSKNGDIDEKNKMQLQALLEEAVREWHGATQDHQVLNDVTRRGGLPLHFSQLGHFGTNVVFLEPDEAETDEIDGAHALRMLHTILQQRLVEFEKHHGNEVDTVSTEQEENPPAAFSLKMIADHGSYSPHMTLMKKMKMPWDEAQTWVLPKERPSPEKEDDEGHEQECDVDPRTLLFGEVVFPTIEICAMDVGHTPIAKATLTPQTEVIATEEAPTGAQ